MLRFIAGNVLSYIGIFPKPQGKEGISVVIRTRNEEEWIEYSLKSLKNFADEIVVVDASTDRTPEIIEEISSRLNLNVKLIRYRPKYPDTCMLRQEDYVIQSNLALKSASYRWIVRWDGDFVAHTSGPSSIHILREFLLELPKNINHVVYVPVVNLDGDVFHQAKGGELNIEVRALTNTEDITYFDARSFEKLHVPYYYKPILIRNQYPIFHMRTVKNKFKVLFRAFWTLWRDLNDYKRFPRLEDYVMYEAKRRWGIENLEEAANYYINNILCKRLVRYDRNRFGDYPELLKPELEKPRYRIIYRDGKIVGRNDTLRSL